MEQQHDYNSQREEIILKEYGRSIQKLAQHLLTVNSREDRTRMAHSLVELMRMLNPNMSQTEEATQKLWDDLFILTNFGLEIDAPYPKPSPDTIRKKPQAVGYSNNQIRYRHFGRGVEAIAQKATVLTDPEERFWALVKTARMMKSFYLIWNKDSVQDVTIISQLENVLKQPLGEEFATRIITDRLLDINNQDIVDETQEHKKKKKKKKLSGGSSNVSNGNNAQAGARKHQPMMQQQQPTQHSNHHHSFKKKKFNKK